MKEELKNMPVNTPENMIEEDFFDSDEESGPTLDLDISAIEEKVKSHVSENFDLSKYNNDKKEEKTVDGNGTAGFDALFDSLYSDVAGANNLITELIERKKTINNNENLLSELKEKMEKERTDFNRYVDEQKKALETEKNQVDDYVRTQRIRIQSEEEKFNADVDATRKEIELARQSLETEEERFALEKEQFAKYKQLEEEKLKNEKIKLDLGREKFEKERTVSEESLKAAQEQFEKEKTVTEESIKAAQIELDTQREQCAKYKELEEKKLELGNHNLSQSCARFKELVSQFNSGFSQLPSDKQ